MADEGVRAEEVEVEVEEEPRLAFSFSAVAPNGGAGFSFATAAVSFGVPADAMPATEPEEVVATSPAFAFTFGAAASHDHTFGGIDAAATPISTHGTDAPAHAPEGIPAFSFGEAVAGGGHTFGSASSVPAQAPIVSPFGAGGVTHADMVSPAPTFTFEGWTHTARSAAPVGFDGMQAAIAVPSGEASESAGQPHPPPARHPPPPPPAILAVEAESWEDYARLGGNAFFSDACRGLTGVPLTSVATVLTEHRHRLDVLEVILPPLSSFPPGTASAAAAILDALPKVEDRKAVTGIALQGSTRLDERAAIGNDGGTAGCSSSSSNTGGATLADVLPGWRTLDLRAWDGGGGLPTYVPDRITAVRVRELEHLVHFPSRRASLQEVEIFGSKARRLREDLNALFPRLAVLKIGGDLWNETSLEALPESIGCCTSLTTLDVSGCASLKALPESIGSCTSLTTLEVNKCRSLEALPESIGSCTSLTTLYVRDCRSLKALPESIGGCTSLTTLYVRDCKSLKALPESIGRCSLLKVIGLSRGAMMISFSKATLLQLTRLTITDEEATSLPESIGSCTSLTTLEVSDCESLQALPESIGSCTSLTTLNVRECDSLKALPESIGSCTLLTTLDVSWCNSLEALPESIGSCTSLTTLNAGECTSLQALPESIGSCTSLTTLNVYRCTSLQALPESIGSCTSLTTLDVGYCDSLEALPESIGSCTSLTTLNASHCTSLQALPESIGSCTSLTTLDVSGCDGLQALPEAIGSCTSLITLDVSACDGLQALPEAIGGCTSLTTLNAGECTRLQALPESIGSCTALATLDIRSTAIIRLPMSLLTLEGTLTDIVCFHSDPLMFPPASVIGTAEYSGDDGDTPAAFSYMKAFATGATQLARDRLMLIGDGGSGKTTLRSALMWSPAVCEQLKQATRAKVSAWSSAHVRQWIFEISAAAELADTFAAKGIDGVELLALQPEDIGELFAGTHRNVAKDKLARTIAFLNSAPDGAIDAGSAAADGTTSLTFLQTAQEFVAWLQHSIGALKPGVIAALEENEVDGPAALAFNDDDWKEMVPPLGPRRKIINAVANAAAAGAGAAAAAISEAPPPLPSLSQPQSQYAPLLDLPHVWTDGIEVESWTAGGYQLWDFAGQLEYYPAHQFFLSASNTVYLLVADASKGKEHCLLRLQHWISFVRSAVAGDDAWYGDGLNQRAPVHVLIVATHTDTRESRHIGIDFLPDVSEALNAQFAPKIKVHTECFKVNYSVHDGGGLAHLKTRLAHLRDDSAQRVEYPASYATVFAALKTEAGSNPEQSIMEFEEVSRIITTASHNDACDDDHFTDTVLKTLELFGMLKRLGNKALIEPVTWLTQITSAFVAPKLQAAVAGYEVEVDPVPSTTFGEVKAMLRERGIQVNDVGLIVEVLVDLKLCFFHRRAGRSAGGSSSDGEAASSPASLDQRVVLPAMLPPVTRANETALTAGRRFRCANREDSIPATLMATVQASLYAVADDVLLLRAGLISTRMFGCTVVVRLSTPKNAGSRAHEHHCSSAIDVLHDESDDGVEHEALNLAVLVVVGAWQESFESIPLVKTELCASGGGEDEGETELPLPCDVCLPNFRNASADERYDPTQAAQMILAGKSEAVKRRYTGSHLSKSLERVLEGWRSEARMSEPIRAATSSGGSLQPLLNALKASTTPHAHKEAIKAHLGAAASMAMDALAAMDASTVETTANCFLEDLQSSIQTATTSWNQPDFKQPLHDRLASVKHLLAHFGHTVASYCDLARLAAGDGAALETISQMVLDPIVACMRRTIETMLADVRAESDTYQKQMAQLSVGHKTIYNEVFLNLTMGTQRSGEAQDVVDFKSMCTAITHFEEQTRRSNPPPRVQPESNILKLTNMCSIIMPHFKTAIEAIFATVQRIELDFRPETKALYRMAEKALLKGVKSAANGGDGTVQESNVLDCSDICDVVGCLVVCEDFRSMREAVEKLKEQTEQDVIVCEVKERWTSSSDGGWRDLICILAVGPQRIMCEVQVVHATMLVVRKRLDAHKAYAKYRSYFELLNFAGLLGSAGGEDDVAGGGRGGDGGGSRGGGGSGGDSNTADN
eukprot:gene6417-2760_t